IKCRKAGLRPAAAVIVATVRALKMNGGVAKSDLAMEDVAALKRGAVNLGRHVENIRAFGVPVVVAINHFTSDTEQEVAALQDYAKGLGVDALLCRHWAEGGAGIEALAHTVAKLADSDTANFQPLYGDDLPLTEKIETVARRIYRAGTVTVDKGAAEQLAQYEAMGYGALPVCIAKTQYSFSTDPSLLGAPEGHTVHVREVRLSAGAGFIVAITGDIMTMPGLPRTPAAESIRLGPGGLVEGLF
ncbi:formate--tetrahydrofolate ligase, partial [Rhizobium sp.]|uniref:formate--tetrahydrofolate ligase n=1 Tax=Rhizobium sp. TaxID=391 RepID=UPI000E9DFED4|nr:formate--tetrahydrofolate ligase [Rhizobium sp.]